MQGRPARNVGQHRIELAVALMRRAARVINDCCGFFYPPGRKYIILDYKMVLLGLLLGGVTPCNIL